MTYKITAWIGLGLLTVGLLVGLIPVSAEGVNCGSAFVASSDPSSADFGSTLVGMGPLRNTQAACDSLRSVVRVPAITTLVLGVGGLALALVLYSNAMVAQDRARIAAARAEQRSAT